MTVSKRKATFPVYTILLISFFLPFITVSCSDATIGQFSGIDLATGFVIDEGANFGSIQADIVPPDIRIIGAMICAVIGMIDLCLLPKRRSKSIGILSVIGAVLLYFFKSNLDREILSASLSTPGLRVEYNFGYWGAFVSFICGAIVQFSALFKADERENPSPDLSHPRYYLDPEGYGTERSPDIEPR